MTNFDPDQFKTKFEITEAAIELYSERDGSFTLKQVAEKTGMEVGDIFNFFPSKKAILAFYYESLVIRYSMMLEEIDDFDDYLLAEKLSNFVFTTFDLMEEQQEFVERTFKDTVFYSFSKTPFEERTEELLKDLLKDDSRVAASSSILMNEYLYSILRKKYLRLIHFWLNDESEGRELSMELTDKYTAFLQEIMYSAVIDKGVDLIKFMFSNRILARDIPFVKNLSSKIEIRE